MASANFEGAGVDATRRIPRVPLALGLGGLLPFWGLALLLLLDLTGALRLSPDAARLALATYGAVIASFLGGIRWGVALREDNRDASRDLIVSVLPSLLAWASLLLLPPRGALIGLAVIVAVWGVVDQDLPRRGVAPRWFGRLRVILSTGAAAALAVGAAPL